MTQAVFIVGDPYHRRDSETKLRNLIAEIRGIRNWNIDGNGEVTIDYDHDVTSSNVIEEALAGIGYKIKHVHDDARLGKADKPNYGVSDEGNKGGKSYG